jgi:hypothetical protein
MSRLNAWIDRDQKIKESYQDILQDNGGSVDVYRKQGSAAAGFSGEVPDPTYLRTILARIDLAKQTTSDQAPDEAQDQNIFTALTDDIDVRRGDQWAAYDLGGVLRSYRVKRVEATQAGTAVWLDILRKA